MFYGFFSIDLTISDEGHPVLIEINGSNSGFDGFSIAYGDDHILRALAGSFKDLLGTRNIYVVSRLVNFGELPLGYLNKLMEDRLYYRTLQNIHRTLPKGIAGVTWARFRTDRRPSGRGAPSSFDALARVSENFRRVFLNVSDTRYVIPSDPFLDEIQSGIVSFKKDTEPILRAIALDPNDVLWLRCPTLAFADQSPQCVLLNEEFPYDAIADNKLFTYDILKAELADNLPLSTPVGNMVSSSDDVGALLGASSSKVFIRKPLVSSQARGIEFLHRGDVEEYCTRMAQLEAKDIQAGNLPLELLGVPDLLANNALSLDVSLVSEVKLSKPILCRRTNRTHYGCIRSLALVKWADEGDIDVRYIGAYWRLARVPVDGDGLLWERFIGSQSQGSFCESLSVGDEMIAADFTESVLKTFVAACSLLPSSYADFRQWEEGYWLDRYQTEAPLGRDQAVWQDFLGRIDTARQQIEDAKAVAEDRGFRRMPSVSLAIDELRASSIPSLIDQPHRIIVPQSAQ